MSGSLTWTGIEDSFIEKQTEKMKTRSKMDFCCSRSGLAMFALGLFLAFTQPACAQIKPGSDKSAAITQALKVIVNDGEAPGNSEG